MKKFFDPKVLAVVTKVLFLATAIASFFPAFTVRWAEEVGTVCFSLLLLTEMNPFCVVTLLIPWVFLLLPLKGGKEALFVGMILLQGLSLAVAYHTISQWMGEIVREATIQVGFPLYVTLYLVSTIALHGVEQSRSREEVAHGAD